jgi:hypothetical protein
MHSRAPGQSPNKTRCLFDRGGVDDRVSARTWMEAHIGALDWELARSIYEGGSSKFSIKVPSVCELAGLLPDQDDQRSNRRI